MIHTLIVHQGFWKVLLLIKNSIDSFMSKYYVFENHLEKPKIITWDFKVAPHHQT